MVWLATRILINPHQPRLRLRRYTTSSLTLSTQLTLLTPRLLLLDATSKF